MAGAKQPIELLIAKGNKHLTKEEIESRQGYRSPALHGRHRAPGISHTGSKADF